MSLDPTPLAQVAGALAAVLLLAWGAARLLRRSPLAAAGPRPNRRLRIEETLAIDPRRRLLLLSCDGREMLVLAGAGTPEIMLGWLPPREPAA
jgi:flagellar protein FliO/FliZ